MILDILDVRNNRRTLAAEPLLDPGHRLASHRSEGPDLFFQGCRLGREVPMFGGMVPVQAAQFP
jgi:hypothetical protein